MAAYSSAGLLPLVIWAATVDPADVPMMRSASVTSTPASDRPAMRPSCHALPAAPPPARTRARWSEWPAGLVAPACWPGIGQFPCRGVRVTAMPSEVAAGLMRGAEEGVVFMGVAFRGLPVGRSRWRLPQSRDRARRGSTHYGYCAHGSHLLPMDHDHRKGLTPATRCAIGIKPVARRTRRRAGCPPPRSAYLACCLYFTGPLIRVRGEVWLCLLESTQVSDTVAP